jgi:integrase
MSIHKDKRTGKWYSHVRYIDWQGQSQRKIKRGFITKKEAVEWEREFMLQRSDDLTMSFEKFVEIYAEDRRPRLRYSTWLSKEFMIKDKLIPYFGKMAMCEIDAKTIIRWQNKLIEYRDANNKPYSQTYLKSIHNQLTAIMTHAFKFYGLKTNPASKAGSMGKKHAKEMKFWTREEYTKFADVTMKDPRAYYMFEVLYWCGLRLGEMLALTYDDIDLENNIIDINKSYQRLSGKDFITDPKTPKSIRKIAVPDFLSQELSDYMALQYGHKGKDRMFQMSKGFVEKRFRSYAEEAGVKQIRVHDLRHSHVSHLIHLGFSPVAIAGRLGHESIEITLRYAHLFPTQQADMANRLNLEMREMLRVS